MVPESAYEQIAYPGVVIPNTAPHHLAVCSLWHHGPEPELTSFRFAELGCGDGANLLGLAFYHPEATFVGIDSSSKALCRAEGSVRKLGLTNIRFVRQDVRDLRPDGGGFDYVVAHGLYSWVPPEAREAILEFCRASLTLSGLAYLSYNAQPGWATRSLVRDTLMRSPAVQTAGIEDKAGRAIELAAQLLEYLSPRNYASAILLAEELERVRHGNPGYVFHEYLAEVNEGFWLRDFVAAARAHALEYVADAQFCRWEGNIPGGLLAALARRTPDTIEQEETADLLCHRYFRASILCRADAIRSSASHDEILQRTRAATSLSCQSEYFDLTEGRVEKFTGTGRQEVALDASITKAAIVLLSARWPLGLPLTALSEQATSLLVSQGYPVPDRALTQLGEDLSALFQAGQIDLRLHTQDYAPTASEFPHAHALARLEAGDREALTTPYHLPLPFEKDALSLVRAMDGSRSRAELQCAFGEQPVNKILEILGRWGLLQPINPQA